MRARSSENLWVFDLRVLQVHLSASPLGLGPQRVGLAFASVAASGFKPEFSHVRMRENFRCKPRRLKLEQMHMNVYFLTGFTIERAVATLRFRRANVPFC